MVGSRNRSQALIRHRWLATVVVLFVVSSAGWIGSPTHLATAAVSSARPPWLQVPAPHVVVDIQGFLRSPSANGLMFGPVTPTRLLDTRDTSPPTPGATTRIETGISGASAVMVNLTMVGSSQAGYVSAGRCADVATGVQASSAGNHGISTAVSNLSLVIVDIDGSFCLANQRAVDLIVDLQGAFSSSGTLQIFSTDPRRVLDTR